MYHGILDIAAKYDVAIAGGDTNTWDGGLVISVTALGQLTARGPLRRDGAQPGDHILVTGRFGGSLLGKHFSFEPRVHAALLLHQQFELHAGIDVSDGLSLDLHGWRRPAAVARRSHWRRCRSIRLPRTGGQQAADGRSALEHALSDGEDFELILAAAARLKPSECWTNSRLAMPLTRIGQMIARAGLVAEAADGALEPLAARV